MKRQAVALIWAVLLVAVAGCKDDEPARVPDFALPDVNPTSATYDQEVSPRDHLQKVSAWYFGHAT